MTVFTPTTDAAKTIPEIIKTASASPLGILALLIVVLGILAYVYFKNAPIKVRVGIFIALLIGASLYAVAITNASQEKRPIDPIPQPTTNLTTEIGGMVADGANGNSLSLVTVTATLSPSPAVTDSNGVFHLKIKTPDPGEPVVLHVTKPGYESLDWTVTPPISNGIRILLYRETKATNTGSAITKGAQSPAITGNGNRVDYSQPAKKESH
jgi:hypothetical protein